MVLRKDFLNRTDRPAPSFKGHKHTADTKLKISVGHTGKPLSEEHRAKLAEKGKEQQQSEATRAKRSASLLGRKHSDEHRANNAKAQTGRKMSDATKAKLTAQGKPHSEEAKKRMSEIKKAYWANKRLGMLPEIKQP